MRYVRFVPSLVAAAVLAGCAGGSHGSSALPSTPAQTAKGTGTAVFVINVPAQQSTTSALRQAQGDTRQAQGDTLAPLVLSEVRSTESKG